MRNMEVAVFIDNVQKCIDLEHIPEYILEHIDEVMEKLCHKTNIIYNLTKPLFSDDYNVLKNLLITICKAHISQCESEPYYVRIDGKNPSEWQW